MFSLFEVVAYSLVALAGAASLALLSHRFRQRNLLKIPGPPNPSLFWGHLLHMFNPYAYPFHEGLYRTYGNVARVYGFLGDIQLVVSDPKACNNIFGKDQPIFEMTEPFLLYGSNFLKFSWTYTYIATNRGSHHRMQRKLLNPAFSTKHMRSITPIFHRVTKQLRENLWSIVSNGPEEINVADWMGKLSLELIGQAGLGYSFGIFEGRDDEYCKALKEWIPTQSSLAVLQNLLPYVDNIFHPKVLKFLGRTLPWPKLHYFMDIVETVNSKSRAIYEAKKRLLESGDDATVKQVGDGKDIISLLSAYKTFQIRNLRVFIIAGTDTTSSALSRILHVLSLHPDAQDKLRKELKEAHEDNEELTHDQLVSLPFLEAVCRETLRLYAPVPGVMRTTRSDVVLPLSAPIRDVDGREVHEIFVPKNTNSVADANIQGVYANTMTFIGGARSCIGFKFSELEMKAVLSQVIPAFQFAPTGAEIIWRYGFISSPSVKGSVGTFHPKLPMIVSRV
ncbi:cytochrome P450 [Lactarius hengduanensis]|nr:cytochrome P450 [Lactarius hengduanensis]